MEYGIAEYAIIFKALGDETRLKILIMLTKGRTCACRILDAFHFTQPTLSYHMKLLSDSGLVNADKDGKWVYYSINNERVELLREFMSVVNEIGGTEDCCNGQSD